jgi:hypothetical protein
LISLDPETKSKQIIAYQLEHQVLLRTESRLVSIDELIEIIFPKDEEERQAAFLSIQENRQNELQSLVDDKKKKEEAKEKSEERQLRLVSDFEKNLEQVQFMKKNLNKVKYDEFVELIDYCKISIDKNNKLKASKAPLDLVSFIGIDAFPAIFQINYKAQNKLAFGVINPKDPLNSFFEKKENSIESFSGYYDDLNKDINLSSQQSLRDFLGLRIRLEGSTKGISLVRLLRDTVTIGRGLSGIAYRDVVCTLQYIATTRLSSMFRCFSKRWRYFSARRRWKFIDKTILHKNFNAWHFLSVHIKFTRFYCFRKLSAWRFYTNRAIFRRNLFRICFWPFFTWRKFSNASATAKEKARFLVGRVIPTVIQIKVFRAWKFFTQAELIIYRKSIDFYKKLIRKNARYSIYWIYDWAKKRKSVRKAWIYRGSQLLRSQLLLKKLIPFVIWKSYVTYKKILRRRVKEFTPIFRAQYLSEEYCENPMCLTANAEKRLLVARKAKNEIGGTEFEEFENDLNLAEGEDSNRVDSGNNRGASTNSAKKKKKKKKKKKNKTVNFNWKANVKNIYDMDTDGEDEEDIPEEINYAYDDVIPIIQQPNSLFFLIDCDTRIMNKVSSLFAGICFADRWNLFESSLRFHRFAYRAFNNLRINAEYKIASKSMAERRRNVTKKIVFRVLKALFNSSIGKANSIALSEAERLNYVMRSQLINKSLRLRHATQEIKINMGNDDDVDEDEKAVNYMKNLNLIDPDDEKYLEQMVEDRYKREQARKLAITQSDYVPPNLLEWDREDREAEVQIAEEMLVFSKKTTLANKEIVEQADITSSGLIVREKKTSIIVDEVLNMESNITQSAVENQKKYVKKFREHVADKLLSVLAKVYLEVQLSLLKEESKLYFRLL